MCEPVEIHFISGLGDDMAYYTYFVINCVMTRLGDATCITLEVVINFLQPWVGGMSVCIISGSIKHSVTPGFPVLFVLYHNCDNTLSFRDWGNAIVILVMVKLVENSCHPGIGEM